jgi:glycosyltransferase involved in cell wall biosynthesis
MQSSMAEQLAMMPLLRNRLSKRLLDACERWLCRKADYVVSSAGLASRVRAAAPLTRVQELRYPSLVRNVAMEEVDRLRAELDISPGQPVVLYTGTFEDYQGLSTLIDAVPEVVSNVADVAFVLVGAPPSKAAELLNRLSGPLPRGAIRMVERQPGSAIPAYLAMAKVVVSPRSSGSNLPLKVLQYLAAGRAIVATSIAAHRTVLTDQLAVLAEPTSSALACAIIGLLTDSAKVGKLESAARQYADENLGWSKFVGLIRSLHPQLERLQVGDEPTISHGRSDPPT